MSAVGAVLVTVPWDHAYYYAAPADNVTAACPCRLCAFEIYRPCDGGVPVLGPPPVRGYCLVNRTQAQSVALRAGWLARAVCLA
jgi:hypothetical protein